MPTKLSNEVLLAAIDGFELKKRKINTQIAELHELLNGHRTGSVAGQEMPTRRRMREAQQRRWAAVRGSR